MSADALIGCVILGFALLTVAYLVLISRARINSIISRGSASAREILNGDE